MLNRVFTSSTQMPVATASCDNQKMPLDFAKYPLWDQVPLVETTAVDPSFQMLCPLYLRNFLEHFSWYRSASDEFSSICLKISLFFEYVFTRCRNLAQYIFLSLWIFFSAPFTSPSPSNFTYCYMIWYCPIGHQDFFKKLFRLDNFYLSSGSYLYPVCCEAHQWIFYFWYGTL